MAPYLTIPDITESQELVSVAAGGDGKSFGIVMAVGDTAIRLMRAAADGEHLPLVVLTLEAQILALDSVYVTDASTSADLVQLTFAVQAVRFV